MLMQFASLESRESRYLTRLGPLFADRDAFLILHALTVRSEPIGSPQLSMLYRIDPSEMDEILGKLIHLGFVRKKGFVYEASEAGTAGMQFLEHALGNVDLEAARTENPIDASLVQGTYRNGVTPVVAASTNNGTWASPAFTGFVLSNAVQVTRASTAITENVVNARKLNTGGASPDASTAPDHTCL
jgi:hypothetical protein